MALRLRKALAAWTTVLCLCLFSTASYSLDLWVDRDSLGGTCSDDLARENVTQSTPWCTLGAAGVEAMAGDTVRVRAGVYNEVQTCVACRDNWVLEVLNSGSQSAPIRFQAEAGEAVILDGTNGPVGGIIVDRNNASAFVEIDGFEIRNFRNQAAGNGFCIFIKAANDVVMSNLDIHGCTGSAVEMHETNRVTFEYSNVYDNALSGFTSAIDVFLCEQDNIIRGNRVWNNTDTHPAETEGHGIILDTCEGDGSALVENNVVWNNEGWCITVFKSDNANVRNNSCWHNGIGRTDTGELITLGNNLDLFNNALEPQTDRLALQIRETGAYAVDFSTIRSDGNLMWAPDNAAVVGWEGNSGSVADYRDTNTRGWGASAIDADPQYANPATGDLSPTSGSQAIDSALASNVALEDINKTPRPVDGDGDGVPVSDRGAYEVGDAGGGDDPQAVLSATPDSGPAPLLVTFDGAASTDDVGIVTYAFDFGDGESASGDTAVVEHTFSDPGTYNASLTVTDGDGNTSTANATVVVADENGNAPVANLVTSVADPAQPLAVTFDATGSTDDVAIVTYAFDFGDTNSVSGDAASVEHTYAQAGEYTVSLTVFDADGNSDVASLTIDVDPDDPGNGDIPTAVLIVSNVSGQPLTVRFDGSESTDDIGVVIYRFDFGDSSGTFDAVSMVEHTYAEPGDYNVSLTVIDADDNRDSTGMSITVTEGGGGGEGPTASFTAIPTTGDAPLTVQFDGSASTDDVGIVTYRFDFGDSSGTFSDLSMVEHTYASPGEYNVALEVLDADGNSDFTKILVTVTGDGGGGGEGPTSSFTADPTSGAAPLTVSFDGSASTDDVGIVIYRYDFGDSSGTYGDQSVVQHTYDQPGEYNVALEVFDADGNGDFSIIKITVGDGGGGGPGTAATLQDGLNDYAGTSDTYLSQASGGGDFSAGEEIREWVDKSHALVRFAIFASEGGPVPDGATVESATLSLYKSSPYAQVYGAHRLLMDWDEGQTSWNNALIGLPWAAAGAGSAGEDYASDADGQAEVSVAAGQWLDIDVTPGVAAMSGGAANYGWRLVRVSGDPWHIKRFHSSEYAADPMLRPKLMVVYTVADE